MCHERRWDDFRGNGATSKMKIIYCCEVCSEFDTSKSGMLAHMETHLRKYTVEAKTGKCTLVEMTQ